MWSGKWTSKQNRSPINIGLMDETAATSHDAKRFGRNFSRSLTAWIAYGVLTSWLLNISISNSSPLMKKIYDMRESLIPYGHG